MRRSTRAAIAAAFAVTSLGLAGSAAHADTATATPWQMVQAGPNGYCAATVYLVDPDQDYAKGWFRNNGYAPYPCMFWLERREYVNDTWTAWTPIGAWVDPTTRTQLYKGSENRTGSYWDGPHYRVRACISVYTQADGWGPAVCSGPGL